MSQDHPPTPPANSTVVPSAALPSRNQMHIPTPPPMTQDYIEPETTNDTPLGRTFTGTFVQLNRDGTGFLTRYKGIYDKSTGLQETNFDGAEIDCSALNAPEPKVSTPNPPEVGNGRMAIAQQTAAPPATKATLDRVFGAGTGNKVEALCKKLPPAAPKP